MMLVISLCDYTGAWSKPWKDAGYDVLQIDIKLGQDVRLLEHTGKDVFGVLAAPPCTEFAASGARWWKEKGEKPLLDGLALVDACCRIVLTHKPRFWALENPVGRLRRWLGPPRLSFNPCDYGGWLDDDADAYTKKTLLWGSFVMPEKKPIEPTQGSKMHLLPPSPDRAALRSVTPAGFAKAFFEANKF
jgi:hypothetical protein